MIDLDYCPCHGDCIVVSLGMPCMKVSKEEVDEGARLQEFDNG